MLPPEVEEGNIEYKCFFSDIKKQRFIELSTQMNWRILEGDGVAIYYIGIYDNGKVYDKLSPIQIKYSFNILKKLVKFNKAIISKSEKNITDNKIWFKVEIKREHLIKVYQEKRILLLGDTNTGKSTFLANLVKKKLDVNGKAKNYTFNHKHELVSGNTSSINYYNLIKDNNNYLFFDTPGNIKYNKTLLKIIQSINYNLVLYFPSLNNEEWEYKNLYFKYFEKIKVPIIELNLKNKINNFPNVNINELIHKNNFLCSIDKYLKDDKIENDDCNFIVLNTYYNYELGYILSGYLASGTINENEILYWYTNDIIKIQVLSIYDSISDKQIIKAPRTISIRVKLKTEAIQRNFKYGFISSNSNIKSKGNLNIEWDNKFDNSIENKELICNSTNNKIILKLHNNKYKLCNNFMLRENLNNNYIICHNYKNIGLINF